MLLVTAAGTGGAWHHQYWHRFSRHHLGLAANEQANPICLEGYALTDGRVQTSRDDQWGPPVRAMTRLWVEVRRIRDGTNWRRASGVGQLRVRGKLQSLHGGCRMRTSFGFLRAPSKPLNPGDFDYAHRLRIDRELFQLDALIPNVLSCCNELTGGAPAPARSHTHV